MQPLDEMTVRAISNILCLQHRPDFDPNGLMEFFRRADVGVPPPFYPVRPNVLPSVSFTSFLLSPSGSGQFEKILMRLASPKEYAGNRALHRSIVDDLNEILEAEGLEIVLDGPNPVIRDLETGDQEGMQVVRDNPASPEPVQPVPNASNEIFVVHGRDLGAKDTVARFLEQVKIKPVVLQELPDLGKTVIEKFEYYAGPSGFAIVLLTPDDTGALKGEGNSTKSRARQNVIFELGYFIGKLGRDRVRVLTKGEEVEILSDYSGVIGIHMDDNDGWEKRLLRELKAAGYDVDANDAL